MKSEENARVRKVKRMKIKKMCSNRNGKTASFVDVACAENSNFQERFNSNPNEECKLCRTRLDLLFSVS